MKAKLPLRIAIAVVGLLAIALTAVGIMNWSNPSPDSKNNVIVVQQGQPGGRTMITMQGPPPSTEAQPVVFAPKIDNGVLVSDLVELAHEVHLTDVQASAKNKEAWKKAMAKAQALLNASCDCEERCWLENFVTAGNNALSDSKDYAASATFLITLPKNDDEATTHKVAALDE